MKDIFNTESPIEREMLLSSLWKITSQLYLKKNTTIIITVVCTIGNLTLL